MLKTVLKLVQRKREKVFFFFPSGRARYGALRPPPPVVEPSSPRLQIREVGPHPATTFRLIFPPTAQLTRRGRGKKRWDDETDDYTGAMAMEDRRIRGLWYADGMRLSDARWAGRGFGWWLGRWFNVERQPRLRPDVANSEHEMSLTRKSPLHNFESRMRTICSQPAPSQTSRPTYTRSLLPPQ